MALVTLKDGNMDNTLVKEYSSYPVLKNLKKTMAAISG